MKHNMHNKCFICYPDT